MSAINRFFRRPRPTPPPPPSTPLFSITVYLRDEHDAPLNGRVVIDGADPHSAVALGSITYGGLRQGYFNVTVPELTEGKYELTGITVNGALMTPIGGAWVPITEPGDRTIVFRFRRLAPVIVVPTLPVTRLGRVFADDRGGFLSLGASWFWQPWAHQADASRFVRTATWMREHGIDSTRAMAILPNAGLYTDRRLDPYAPGFTSQVRDVLIATAAQGLRTGLTLIADPIDTHARHTDWVVRLCTMIRDIPHTVTHVEIMNEAGNKYSADMLADLTRVARQTLNDRVLVVPSSAEDYRYPADDPEGRGGKAGNLEALYGAGNPATMLSAHPERIDGDGGFRFSRQPYGYRDLRYAPGCGTFNEGRGPASSGLFTADPVLLTADLVMTYLCGFTQYVFHSGTGVYGKDYDTPYGHRYADFWDIPNIDAILAPLAALRRALPVAIVNGSNLCHGNPKFSADGSDPRFPFVSPRYSGTPSANTAVYWDEAYERFGMRAYCVWVGGTAYVITLNQHTPIVLQAAYPVSVVQRELLTFEPFGRRYSLDSSGVAVESEYTSAAMILEVSRL